MPTIGALSSTDVLRDTDVIPLFSPELNDTIKATLPTLVNYVVTALEGEPDSTVYSLTLNDTGFVVAALPGAPGAGVWVQISLSAAASTGQIILPMIDDRAPGQEVLVTCTKAIAALTVSGGDAAVLGAPTSLTANGFFKLRYDSISNQWIRVG